jgi:hypothetical protein
VTVSFDGAGNLDLMDHWLDVADRGHARFSFFLTGIYLLDQAHRSRYTGPHQAPGASSVGFAHVPEGMTSESYITTLVQRFTAARQIGHEVGTHYNGHFCQGVPDPVGTWSAADWASELDQFTGFAANISTNNGFTDPIPSPLDPGGVVGGRTPGRLGLHEGARTVRARGVREAGGAVHPLPRPRRLARRPSAGTARRLRGRHVPQPGATDPAAGSETTNLIRRDHAELIGVGGSPVSGDIRHGNPGHMSPETVGVSR